MPTTYIMFEENDMLVEVDGLQDSSDDSYLNAATVTATIKDADGVEVSGISLPITLSYVSSSNGKYQGVFDKLLSLDPGDMGTIEITATEGTLDAFWELCYTCQQRQE